MYIEHTRKWLKQGHLFTGVVIDTVRYRKPGIFSNELFKRYWETEHLLNTYILRNICHHPFGIGEDIAVC